LAKAGLDQYEISNFSRPGFESRHNLRYWRRRPYLGLGLDASSMLRAKAENGESSENTEVLRATTTDDLSAYLAGNTDPKTAWLSSASQHEEAWFLGLRLNRGVEIAEVEREFGVKPAAAALRVVSRLQVDGLLTVEDGRVKLTPRGRLISNEAFQEFLGPAQERELTPR
jgi:oxygen-independent coproporphyrinogen-3 oxidase